MDRAGFTGTPIEATFEKGIRVLDEMWIEHIFEQIHANNPGNSTTKTALTVSSTPLSPELFDTLF